MTSVPLGQLAGQIGAPFYGSAEVRGISADTRSCGAGDLFVCMPSARRDTHTLLPDAKSAGAVAAVVRSQEGVSVASDFGLAAILVDRPVPAFGYAVGLLSRSILGDVTRDLKVIGVTGTNGKTTVAWMVKHALDALGLPCAYLGTLGFLSDAELVEVPNTTPYPVELWNHLLKAYDSGHRAVCLEASSHALYERRLGGVRFDVGVFTNLTQDHLDFHGSMEEYAAAKKLLFTEYGAGSEKVFCGCLNVDDPTGAKWTSEIPCKTLTFGHNGRLCVELIEARLDGLSLSARFDDKVVRFSMRMGGTFNVENTSAALSALLAMGYGLEESTSALSMVKPVPGRFEPVENPSGTHVIIDYAHTPDALEKLLRSVIAVSKGRIVTVFGCGGDRDRTKRPLMGQVAMNLSDHVVVTSDNPRTEDPELIIDEIVAGLNPQRFTRIVDRGEAIAYAMREAKLGDVVVIAGKGHENYQIIGHHKFPMDDRELALAGLEGVKA